MPKRSPLHYDLEPLSRTAARLKLLRRAVAGGVPELGKPPVPTIGDFCTYVGIQRTAWMNYEGEHGRISIDAALRIKMCYPVSVDWILTGAVDTTSEFLVRKYIEPLARRDQEEAKAASRAQATDELRIDSGRGRKRKHAA